MIPVSAASVEGHRQAVVLITVRGSVAMRAMARVAKAQGTEQMWAVTKQATE